MNAQENIKIESDHQYTITPERYWQPLVRDSLKIEEIRDLPFASIDINILDIEKEYWGRFRFEKEGRRRLKTICFFFNNVDDLTLYVPEKSGFREYRTGFFRDKKPLTAFYEANHIIVDGTRLDFTKPFYFKNVPKTLLGTENLNFNFKVETHSNIPISHQRGYKDVELSNKTNEFIYAMLIGMMIISFIFVLLHYMITRKIYFLYYSIYMFCLIFNYGYRAFYFYNFYADIEPVVYFYFNQNGQPLAQLAYMFFFRSFIDMKNNYKKLNVLFSWSIYFFITFIVIYYIFISIYPHTYFHIQLMSMAMLLFSFTNLLSAVYALIKKGTIETKIMIIGCLFLAIGYIVASKFNFFIFIPVVVLETAIFMSVLSYLDLKNYKKAIERDNFKEINELKIRFFSNISHEFRTPLTLIAAPVQKKLEQQQLSEEDRNDFEMMQRNSDRLLNLVDQLLEVSKAESGNQKLQIQKNNVLGFIHTLSDSFRHKASQKDLNYTIAIKSTNTNVWYDKDIVEKITTNLLSNAVKYTPEKGKVFCNATIRKGTLYLDVKNTGKGLSKDEQEKVFERFYQTNEYQPGSGIGLALVKELVALHKGTITVESQPDSWTTFKIRLPVNKNVYKESEVINNVPIEKPNVTLSTKVNKDMASTEAEDHNTINNALPIVLIVEDNKDLRVILRNIFKEHYQVISAKNGEEGIELAYKYIPDLIISDVMMPVKDGIVLTRELKNDERTSHIPIILLTAKVGEDHELTGITTGADDYIIKPFNAKILVGKVNNRITLRQKLQERYVQEPESISNSNTINTLDKKFWNRIHDVLQERLKEHTFNIEEFSAEIGMSRNHLYRKIKALTGMSPSKFITFKRLKQAEKLLKKSDLNISEIVYDVGFNNVSYFNRSFREMYGCTPTEYAEKFT